MGDSKPLQTITFSSKLCNLEKVTQSNILYVNLLKNWRQCLAKSGALGPSSKYTTISLITFELAAYGFDEAPLTLMEEYMPNRVAIGSTLCSISELHRNVRQS